MGVQFDETKNTMHVMLSADDYNRKSDVNPVKNAQLLTSEEWDEIKLNRLKSKNVFRINEQIWKWRNCRK